MLTYSVRTLLAVVGLAAVFCFLVFVVKPIYRVPAMFTLVLMMPAPLAVLMRRGGSEAKSFGLGGLVTYGAWLLLGGLPCAAMIAYHFIVLNSVRDYYGLEWMAEYAICKNYAGYIGLYAPWILIPLGGLVGLMAHSYCEAPAKSPSQQPNSNRLD